MSLPIPSTIIVQGATALAGEVARRIGEAVGFADVLDSGADAAPTDSPLELQRRLVDSVQAMLRESGLVLNQPLQLRVQSGGRLRVSPEHPQAAEIEKVLSSSDRVRQLAHQVAASAESSPQPIGLTIPAATASILPVPGGYPNW